MTLGALYHICSDPNLEHVRQQLEIDGHSRILLISTEGDTDPEGFKKIVIERNI